MRRGLSGSQKDQQVLFRGRAQMATNGRKRGRKTRSQGTHHSDQGDPDKGGDEGIFNGRRTRLVFDKAIQKF